MRQMGMGITPAQREAAHFLEAVGGSFCGNFGYNNVLEIAKETLHAIGDPAAEARLYRTRGLKVRRGPTNLAVVQ
jgi:hypothetical protein